MIELSHKDLHRGEYLTCPRGAFPCQCLAQNDGEEVWSSGLKRPPGMVCIARLFLRVNISVHLC